MNIPPAEYLVLPLPELRGFATRLAVAAGLPPARAELLGRLLSDNDARGVFSHGTQQLATYTRLLRDGELNADPQLTVVRESASSVLVDGDGSLGYFAATEGTQRLLTKLETSDIAVLLTRNHGHFGAAGLYARMTLAADVLCFVTSGHQLRLQSGDPVYTAAGGSPMAFSAPTGHEDPLVLDFGAMHDLYEGSPHRDDFAARAPGLVHRMIGTGTVCQAWGGLLAGVPLDPARSVARFPGANQGSMVIALRIDAFLPVEQFKAEMDAYARAVAELTPLEPGGRSYLPGGIEAERERQAQRDGVPVGVEHQRLLTEAAERCGLPTPW